MQLYRPPPKKLLPNLKLLKQLINDLVILGAGGHGREVASLVEAINRNNPTWALNGFIYDANQSLPGNGLGHHTVGDTQELASPALCLSIISDTSKLKP